MGPVDPLEYDKEHEDDPVDEDLKDDTEKVEELPKLP